MLTEKTKTSFTKKAELERQWFEIDASGVVVGRMAAHIARLLMGKHKPTYSANIDHGDFVIVTNADKIKFTGKKWSDKEFFWHTGYPGGIKSISMDDLREKDVTRIVYNAVRRMLPKGPMGKQMIKKLRVYADGTHEHNAQKPTKIDFAKLNDKNARN